MKQKTEILNYYDDLAVNYDQDRFQNSYGKYLDQQERQLLNRWLRDYHPKHTLDLGCGTGRLLDYAENGVDFSAQMIAQASAKFPDHQLIQSEISDLPFNDQQFDVIFSMHVFMHLDEATIEKALGECRRVLRPGGRLIVDFPNAKRRKAIRYQKKGWHANTALTPQRMEKLAGKGWKLHSTAAFLFFPIHRIPVKVRRYMRPSDSLLCRSPLKHWASYYCIALQKQG